MLEGVAERVKKSERIGEFIAAMLEKGVAEHIIRATFLMLHAGEDLRVPHNAADTFHSNF